MSCVQHFPKVEQLVLKATVSATELAEYCVSNPKLIYLEINNNIYGNLTEFLPHCNQMQTLKFTIKSDFTDSEYIAIAELPELCELSIRGEHKIGSLNTLIKALARKEHKTLRKLMISGACIDIEEIKEMLQIQSLEYFETNGIEGLSIIVNSIRFDQKLADLTLYFNKEVDATDVAALPNVINFSTLLLVSNHKIGTLKKLFETIALQKSAKLKRLRSTSSANFQNSNKNESDFDKRLSSSDKITALNNEELIELLKIKSLEVVDCSIDDSRPIQFPAQLAQIEELCIRTCAGGSLTNLFHALALQEYSKLSTLCIEGHHLDFDDVTQIAKLKCLTYLKCGFADLENIHLLTKIKTLEILGINSRHQLMESSENILKLFISFNGNLSIYYADVISMDKNLRALTIQMSETICSEDLVPLTNLPNLPNLIISGRHTLDSLTPLLTAFASNQSTALQEICIDIDSLCHNELVQISRIKSLRYLECGFCDPRSIKLLAELSNLENLRIKSLHDLHEIAEGVLSVLQGCANEVTVIRDYREISFNKNLKKLTISNTSYDNEILDAQEYALLAELPQLNALHIQGEHKLGSFESLFLALVATKQSAIEEISIVRNSISEQFSKPTISPEETKAIAKILSLRKLKCGFLDANSIEILAQLTELQELVITTHKRGSLMQFLESLSLRHSSNLQSLVIEENELTAEETIQVARVKSLRRLECGFVGQNIECLAQMIQLAELTIKSLESDALSQLIRDLASRGPRKFHLLNIKSTPIGYNDSMALVGIRTLRSLHCTFMDNRSLELLVQLPELQALDIQFNQSVDENIKCLAKLKMLSYLQIASPAVGSLTALFREMSLRSKPILYKLDITDNDVGTEELQQIIKINSLRRLKCGLSEEESFEYFSKLRNLEVLEICSYHDLNEISQSLLLILKKCRKLTDINFHYGTRFISLEFVCKALKILEVIRYPPIQYPLELRVPYFGGLTPEQVSI